MGGAERSARKKKQAARAVVEARGGNDRTKVVIGVVVVALLAIGVIGGVLWSRASTSDLKPVNTATAAPATRDGSVVVVGKDTAQVTIDVYEDFLCPACSQFEKVYGEQLRKELDAGNLKVRYHMLPMLNNLTTPPGYSAESANAALCAADSGKYAPYHESLFAAQPREGGKGHDKAALVKLGKDIGITDSAFEPCVQNGTHDQILKDEMTKTNQAPALQRDGRFRGTPTVASGDKVIDLQNENWLTDLLK